MLCPKCQATARCRITTLKDGARDRTYVCGCGWSFDTREEVYRMRSPEQRRKYRTGDPMTRRLAQKAKSIARINGWKNG